jgi:hypothetical protein
LASSPASSLLFLIDDLFVDRGLRKGGFRVLISHERHEAELQTRIQTVHEKPMSLGYVSRMHEAIFDHAFIPQRVQ